MNRQISFYSSLALKLAVVITLALFASTMFGQNRGAITGRVADSSGAILQGARVQLQPSGITLTTNAWGEFTFINIPQGTYTVTISYVGFEPFSQSVTVGDPSAAARNDAQAQAQAASEFVSHQAFFDRDAASMVFQVLNGRTDAVVDQYPDEAVLRRRAYFHALDMTKDSAPRALPTDRTA